MLRASAFPLCSVSMADGYCDVPRLDVMQGTGCPCCDAYSHCPLSCLNLSGASHVKLTLDFICALALLFLTVCQELSGGTGAEQ